jgi:3-hydroxybutyrate dehydrogenase
MKTVLITGAGSGIGQALALAFAKDGYHVMVTDMNLVGAQDTVAKIQQQGGEALAQTLDVTDEMQMAASFAAMMQAWGRCDCVISNAGVQMIKTVDQLALKDWQLMMRIHLDGAFLVTREALKIMYPQNFGRIIYMGSIHSKLASEGKAPYVTAKHGLLGLCKTVAKEGVSHNVGANVICPGFVRTPLVDKQIPEQAKTFGISEEEVVKKIMLGETVDKAFTTLEEISDTALFLANYPNLGLTGQSVLLSHGWEME